MSGFLKPASSGFRKPDLQNIRGLLKPAGVSPADLNRRQKAGTKILERLSEKSEELESVCIEVVLKLKFEYLLTYEVKKCKNHKRSYRKY
jgi:hypothetical protein